MNLKTINQWVIFLLKKELICRLLRYKIEKYVSKIINEKRQSNKGDSNLQQMNEEDSDQSEKNGNKKNKK